MNFITINLIDFPIVPYS